MERIGTIIRIVTPCADGIHAISLEVEVNGKITSIIPLPACKEWNLVPVLEDSQPPVLESEYFEKVQRRLEEHERAHPYGKKPVPMDEILDVIPEAFQPAMDTHYDLL